MTYIILFWLYRSLVAAVIAFYSFFAIYFLATSDWSMQMGSAWFNASSATLNLFQVFIERHLHLGIVWQHLIVPWLSLPVWVAILISLFVAWLELWVLKLIFKRIL
ncbi:MAG: hypothetical protein ACR2NY_00240 [Alphaproteobacteria bacterium]